MFCVFRIQYLFLFWSSLNISWDSTDIAYHDIVLRWLMPHISVCLLLETIYTLRTHTLNHTLTHTSCQIDTLCLFKLWTSLQCQSVGDLTWMLQELTSFLIAAQQLWFFHSFMKTFPFLFFSKMNILQCKTIQIIPAAFVRWWWNKTRAGERANIEIVRTVAGIRFHEQNFEIWWRELGGQELFSNRCLLLITCV